MKPFNRYIIILIFLTKAVLGYAPDQLTGYKLDQTDTYYIFLSESIMDEHDVEEGAIRPGRSYTYVKDGDNTGTLSKPYADGLVDTYDLLFTSSSGGVITNDSNWPFTFTRNEQATTTSLDGSIFTLSNSDGVSETLSFENGTLTSTFVDPAEGTIVTSNQSYLLDPMSSNSWKITPNDGDIYFFDSSAGTGTLTDYENGVIDTSGSWNFTFERYVWEDYDNFNSGALDSSKWDVGYFGGGQHPVVVGGRIELKGGLYTGHDETKLPQDLLPLFQNSNEGKVFLFIKEDGIQGMEVDITLPSFGNSPGAGMRIDVFAANPLSSYGIELGEDEDPNWGGVYFYYDYLNPAGKVVEGTKAADWDTTYRVGFLRAEGKTTLVIDGQIVQKFDQSFTSGYWSFNALNEAGSSFVAYADNVRVLRRSSGSPSIQVAPLALSAFRDKVYLHGQNGPVEIDGASEINFDLQLIGQPTVSAATMTVDSVTYDLASFQAPTAFRTNYGYSSFDDELFDVESSSESDWNPYINGKTFNFNITVDGITYSYAHNLPAESSLPSTPNTSFAESLGWKTDSDGYAYQEARAGNSLTLTWDTFSLASSDDFITVSVEELVGDNEIEVMGSTSLPVTATSYEFPSNLFESGKKYTLYVAFHKVLESENPTGFEHQSGTNTSQSLLITTARAVTAVDVVIVDTTPVTVVSDGSGQAVVVQVRDEYRWDNSLDGVTLWSVSGSQSEGEWNALTAKFSGGNLLYGFEFKDDVADTGNNKVSYQIDENGYIKSLEDDGDYQYYNPVIVENGVIGTIQNDEGVDSVANNGINQVDQWFFTTRAAAEEYYYSKVNPKDWMWFDNYPWVYSSEMKEWLYFYPSGSKLLYYSNKNKAWREFSQ